ncbi:histidine phosphatase family protein [Streptomyces sp. NRRL S-87]|uniref:histidine phosphatase family protein n=1 Tax=Streptomyces sp. NRRL S-87 TaxID=1463920 RepID=UPI0004BFBA16|nr:histidine phosphatase family protein [Streptomyces sp. NRRL S-87]
MHVRVTLVAAARSAPLLAERFDDDRPLDRNGWQDVAVAAHGLVPLGAAELRYCSPTPRSRATGEALGFAPLAQPALRECDMGRWRGLTLGEVAAREPAAVDAWLADPLSAPHGGESLTDFITRVGGWLDTRALYFVHTDQRTAGDGAIVAVAEPSVVRAALVYALKVPPLTYWNVDVRPLAAVTLTGWAGCWQMSLRAAA